MTGNHRYELKRKNQPRKFAMGDRLGQPPVLLDSLQAPATSPPPSWAGLSISAPWCPGVHPSWDAPLLGKESALGL